MSYSFSVSPGYGCHSKVDPLNQDIDAEIVGRMETIIVGDSIIIKFSTSLSHGDELKLEELVKIRCHYIPPAWIGDKLKNFDSLVADDGSGDYRLPSEAFAAGAKTVYIRKGTYEETTDIVIPNHGVLYGEPSSPVKIKFTGNCGIRSDGSGGITFTSGTISITNGSTHVIGIATNFTVDMVNKFIMLDRFFYKIVTVNNTGSLNISSVYNGRTISGKAYIIQSMNFGIELSNLSVSQSSGANVYLRGIKNALISKCSFIGGNIGLQLVDCNSCSVENCTVISSTSHGFILSNCKALSFLSGSANNCGGDGYKIIGDDNSVIFNGIFSSNNGGSGINVGGTSNGISVNDSTSRNNNGCGINTAAATKHVEIDGCLILENNADGVYVLGDETVISDCIINGNGGNGVQILASANDCLISGNIITSNEGDGIHISSIDCIVTANRVKNNREHGIHLLSPSGSTTLGLNRLNGNYGSEIHTALG